MQKQKTKQFNKVPAHIFLKDLVINILRNRLMNIFNIFLFDKNNKIEKKY